MRKKLFSLTLVLSILMFSWPAFAFVTTWDYDIEGIFIDWEPSTGISLSNSSTLLSWGISTGYGRSSLEVDGNSGTVTTDGDWAAGLSLEHKNWPINYSSAFPLLTLAQLQMTVTLNPTGSTVLASFPYTFDIGFCETPNIVNGVQTPVNDIFALVGGFPNFNFNYNALEYFVNVMPGDNNVLSLLTDAQAELAGVAHGTYGFTTPESVATTLPFIFNISTTPIPEPSTLLLLGCGLLGLGLFSRRRRGSKL